MSVIMNVFRRLFYRLLNGSNEGLNGSYIDHDISLSHRSDLRIPPLLNKKGGFRKTRNPYIDDNFEYILLEPDGYIQFDYTSERNSQKRHEIFCKFIAGSEEGEPINLVGDTV